MWRHVLPAASRSSSLPALGVPTTPPPRGGKPSMTLHSAHGTPGRTSTRRGDGPRDSPSRVMCTRRGAAADAHAASHSNATSHASAPPPSPPPPPTSSARATRRVEILGRCRAASTASPRTSAAASSAVGSTATSSAASPAGQRFPVASRGTTQKTQRRAACADSGPSPPAAPGEIGGDFRPPCTSHATARGLAGDGGTENFGRRCARGEKIS